MKVEPAAFKAAMRHLPSSVNIIACRTDDQVGGLTATAVCSLCAEPPSLLVCINQSSSTHALLRQAGRFSVNTLDAGQLEVARVFSSSDPADRARRFQTGTWVDLASGSPGLENAAVVFDCKLTREIPHGTHSILIGLVTEIRTGAAEAHLLYLRGGYVTMKSAPEPARA